MELTAQDRTLIDKLRREQSQWRTARWIVLGLAIISTVLAAIFGWLLYHSMHWEAVVPVDKRGPLDANEVLTIDVVWTILCVWSFFALAFFTTAWRKWQGDAVRQLLLRLLEARKENA